VLLVVCGFCMHASAQRTISADEYADLLKGMWAGQLLGNYAGRPVEGATTTYDGYNITEYPIKWDDLATATWRLTNGEVYKSGFWNGDDDTCFEFLYANLLKTNLAPSNAELTALWDTDVKLSEIYVANRQAKLLISTYGKDAGDSGSARYNMHSQWSIDSQITTESLGSLAPGMRGQAADLAGQFGSITNNGLALHTGQFYATMYAHAPFAQDVRDLVDTGLQAVPTTSRTHTIIQSAIDAYQADLDDNGSADGWLDARNAIVDLVSQRGRYRSWVESGINTGLTVLSLLYGQGNARDTIEYAVRGGYDSDCNPATAAGLLGMMKGYDAVVTDLGLETGPDAFEYRPNSSTSLSGNSYTLDQISQTLRQAGEQQILSAYGAGAIVGEGADRTYFLGQAGTGPDQIGPLVEKPPPAGPAGLVGGVLESGGTVQVQTSATNNNPNLDRQDHLTLIDGATDVTYSGAMPYDTYTGSTSPRQDWYQLSFSQPVPFAKVVFHEGDIRWNGINNDPHVVEPLGGYFTDLTVQVLREGIWEDVDNLNFSEELDPLIFFQQIEMTFNPVWGSDIRIIGLAGGSRPYTSCVELEAFAPLAGDINNDGFIDVGDLGILAANWEASSVGWLGGDLDGDGVVDIGDLGILAGNWQGYPSSGQSQVPEPSTMIIFILGGIGLLARRREKVRIHSRAI